MTETTRRVTPTSHGELVAAAVRHITQAHRPNHPVQLSKREQTSLQQQIITAEHAATKAGVNFSRIQIATLLQQQAHGHRIEFETLGPYLAAYTAHDGHMTPDNLVPEDAIGLRLAVTFRQLFPTARLISLCDDYNAQTADGTNTAGIGNFSPAARNNFHTSLVHLLQSAGAIPAQAVAGQDYLLVSEADKVAEAEQLVAKLEILGCIERKGDAIIFNNPAAENPLHRKFHLRSNSGKWMCVTLDAAGFLKAENLEITHIIALPAYMRNQQDKLWEILRMFQFSPSQYHNLFYDPTLTPEAIAASIEAAFAQ